jgi:hypothetical protein
MRLTFLDKANGGKLSNVKQNMKPTYQNHQSQVKMWYKLFNLHLKTGPEVEKEEPGGEEYAGDGQE